MLGPTDPFCLGTGIWAIEFAEQNPESSVIGTDISSIQPLPRTSNCSFVIHDSEKEEWCFPQPFDFIHMRSIGPCFQHFPTVLEKSYENMRPGGWIELQDCVWKPGCVDTTMQGTSIPEFFDRVCRGARTLGHDLLKATRFTTQLEEAGFVDIQEVIVYNGGSPWPRDPKMKQIGYYLGTLLYAATESHGKLLRSSGLSEEELESLKTRFKADLNRIDIHWYLPV